MASNILTTAFCGSAFGAALTVAGLHRPEVIISQLTLSNFHMLESFLTAATGSVALVTLLKRTGFISTPPRGYSSIGMFGHLDGNIIGGLLQGVGMALAGSCPGTVFAQVGSGIKSGLYTLAGLLIGGILWTGILRPHLQKTAAPLPGKKPSTAPSSIDKALGISKGTAVAVVEIIFSSAVAAAVWYHAEKTRGLVHPVVGGLLVASAQLISMLLRKTLLGTSTAVEEAGDCFWSCFNSGNGVSASSASYKNILFVSGMMAGARLVVAQYPSATGAGDLAINEPTVVAGGILLAVGSRMAGGCTSGHGISGISLLSVSSFVTVAAMFAGGISTALALYGTQ